MTIACFDALAGVAGDMWVGALLDAGLPLEPLVRAVDSLQLPGVAIRSEAVHRAGMAATRFVVDGAEGAHAHRGLSEIRGILARAAVPDAVRERAVLVFEALGEAEAKAHGIPVEQVHFHEVGAVDAIVDILCACLGLHELGVERVYVSEVEVGSGSVSCAHGLLPLPAPGALFNLLGVPVRRSGLRGERTTPTGAALLKVLCDGYEPTLRFVPTATGMGAGTRDDRAIPNVLRVTLGRERSEAGVRHESIDEVACNVDTADGEQLGWLLAELLRRGAVDAWAVPATMKKGRPGHVIHALVAPDARAGVVELLLEESTSLGVRTRPWERDVLDRWTEPLDTEWGPVQLKCARLPSGRVLRRPEDDDVVRIAAALGVGRRDALERLLRCVPGGPGSTDA
ncbi:MAG: nickel pincer cofactor biosynthesis protein LarC [Planctomycetota bacterium]|nr:nickel pincer cofactor biosynthesis protein LarC [Planctomycetota bacterium]MDA1222203.1 nickel pincer cofactor biosynthesis protein LarC [Planctomycetota bacterium]